MTRTRLAGPIIALAVTGALLAGCAGTTSSGRIPAPSARIGAQADGALPTDLATMPLTEANGTTTTLAAFRGKAVMIADFMTLCTDICPLISANTAATARALAAQGAQSQTALLEITLDPHRDTLHRLRAYQKLYGAEPSNWILLRASPPDTHRLWHYFGVYDRRVKEGTPADTDWLTGKPLTYDIVHSDDLIYLDREGRERYVIDGSPDTQGLAPPRRLARFLGSQGQAALMHPNPSLDWTVPDALRVFSWLLDRRIVASGAP
ncbi:MAG TPA: SCO family protein [Mycobacteriales bacterium]|nr:SCO family protein [Mycobacteriales bacterium]